LSLSRSAEHDRSQVTGASPLSRRAGGAEAADGEPTGAALAAGWTRHPLAGALGYALHAVTFLTPAIAALVHFGPVVWFVSSVSVSLAVSSLRHGCSALRARDPVHSER
jgi:hypothetical protein